MKERLKLGELLDRCVLDKELQGLSVFARGDHGAIYHTYSTYGRGQDILNGAYNMLDMTPKGRDEDQLPFTMQWVKLHDEYAS